MIMSSDTGAGRGGRRAAGERAGGWRSSAGGRRSWAAGRRRWAGGRSAAAKPFSSRRSRGFLRAPRPGSRPPSPAPPAGPCGTRRPTARQLPARPLPPLRPDRRGGCGPSRKPRARVPFGAGAPVPDTLDPATQPQVPADHSSQPSVAASRVHRRPRALPRRAGPTPERWRPPARRCRRDIGAGEGFGAGKGIGAGEGVWGRQGR